MKTWKTPYTVSIETEAYRLLCFRHTKKEPIIIIPPQAGHHSYIADYADGQSLVQCAISNTDKPVYAIEWKSATAARKNEGVDDLLAQLNECIDHTGPAHIVGLCQGGWLATIYAALNPDNAISLTIAGAPIDTHAGNTVLSDAIHKVPMIAYQTVVDLSGGLMLGDIMLSSWKSFNPKIHYIDRYMSPNDNTNEFYQWYDLTQNLSGKWYLWCIKNLFKKNLLYKNKMVISDRKVDLRSIKCPVNVICGESDDITPPKQTIALIDYCKHGKSYIIPKTGHIGVFMGRTGINGIWADLFKDICNA
jgi:poly(3-hydroxyalkanoate) synthetase